MRYEFIDSIVWAWLSRFKSLRTEVRGDFNIHGTKNILDAVFHQNSKWNIDPTGYFTENAWKGVFSR